MNIPFITANFDSVKPQWFAYISTKLDMYKNICLCVKKLKSRKYILMIAAIPFKGRIITKPQNGEMYI